MYTKIYLVLITLLIVFTFSCKKIDLKPQVTSSLYKTKLYDAWDFDFWEKGPRLHIAGIYYHKPLLNLTARPQIFYTIDRNEGWRQQRNGICYAKSAGNANVKNGEVVYDMSVPSRGGMHSVTFTVSVSWLLVPVFFRAFAINYDGKVVYSKYQVWELSSEFSYH